MSTLRTAAIRLAYENPELRPVLLPLLVETGGMERQAAKFPTDLTPYGVTAAELAAFKNKMQSTLQETVQAFPPPSVFGTTALSGFSGKPGEWGVLESMRPNAAIGVFYYISLPPQFGSKARVVSHTMITAMEPATPYKKEVKPYWYISVYPDYITEPTAKARLYGILKGPKTFNAPVADYSVALQRIDAIKPLLLAAAKSIS